jgi:glycine/D-amino acid oxidase-like deaminating enzyme
MKSFDIAIIGAGIVGAACAFRLASEGFSPAII